MGHIYPTVTLFYVDGKMRLHGRLDNVWHWPYIRPALSPRGSMPPSVSTTHSLFCRVKVRGVAEWHSYKDERLQEVPQTNAANGVVWHINGSETITLKYIVLELMDAICTNVNGWFRARDWVNWRSHPVCSNITSQHYDIKYWQIACAYQRCCWHSYGYFDLQMISGLCHWTDLPWSWPW